MNNAKMTLLNYTNAQMMPFITAAEWEQSKNNKIMRVAPIVFLSLAVSPSLTNFDSWVTWGLY